MGWWSCSIMGGDTPLDYVGTIAKVVFGLDHDYDVEPETFFGFLFTKEMLEKEGVHDKIQKAIPQWMREDTIFGQVVGAIYLWTGARMPQSIKENVLHHAKEELAGTEKGWHNPEEREMYLRDFIEKVEKHWEGGERVDLPFEGLMDKIHEHIAGAR